MEIDKRQKFSYRVSGDYALFTDPLTRIGGEKHSYSLPTYQALIGMTQSIYWKPSIIYYIKKIRVLNSIQMESRATNTPEYYSRKEKHNMQQYTYSYLKDVAYEVSGYFDFNYLKEKELGKDFNLQKHSNILQRSIKNGGRRDVFLGTRECRGLIEPCKFESTLNGIYDEQEIVQHFGTMVHGFDYPSETGEDTLRVRLWYPEMKKGIVKFLLPSECSIKKEIRKISKKEQSRHRLTENGGEFFYELV